MYFNALILEYIVSMYHRSIANETNLSWDQAAQYLKLKQYWQGCEHLTVDMCIAVYGMLLVNRH